MSKLKKLKFVVIFISIIFACIYLTFVIDTYTLNTWLKRVFIFCYFVIMSCLALYLYSKRLKHKYTLIPLLCAIIAVVLGQNLFLPKEAEHTVYIQATENTNSEHTFNEVWLVDIEIDGHRKELSKLQMNDIVKWSYVGDFDDYYFLPTENSESNVLSFTVVGEEIKLIFGVNTWSGNVRIFDGEGYDEIITLYSENTEYDRAEHTLNVNREYSVFERILYSAGAVIVICFGFKVLFGIVFHFIDKKKAKPSGTKPI